MPGFPKIEHVRVNSLEMQQKPTKNVVIIGLRRYSNNMWCSFNDGTRKCISRECMAIQSDRVSLFFNCEGTSNY